MKYLGKLSGFARLMRPVFLIIAIALILCVVIATVYFISAHTTPSGQRSIKGLGDSVVITFDEADIPHIQAKSQADALFALGYLRF